MPSNKPRNPSRNDQFHPRCAPGRQQCQTVGTVAGDLTWGGGVGAMMLPLLLARSLCAVAGAPKPVSLDYSAAGTPLRLVYGTDRGPQCQGVPPFSAAHPQDSGADTSEALHSMGASVIRTHGSGALDWEKLFPHPNLDVRTDDPANYDFAAGDAWLQRVVSKGFEPYLRLGAGQFTRGAGLPPPGRPYNVTALVDVMLHIVMHYEEGALSAPPPSSCPCTLCAVLTPPRA